MHDTSETPEAANRNDGAGPAEVPAQEIDKVSRLEDAPRLSPLERRKREDAVRFANASMRLEGFKVSAEEEARSDRFIAGEIDLAEFLRGR